MIHCSASPNGDHWTGVDVNKWHKDRGFKRRHWWYAVLLRASTLFHIGYHEVFEVLGGVTHGRSWLRWLEIGAHCRGFNRNSIGFCFMGTDKFTIPQWEMAALYVEKAKARFEKTHTVVVCGHNERDPLNKARCPGFSVRDWEAGGFRPLAGHILKLAA